MQQAGLHDAGQPLAYSGVEQLSCFLDSCALSANEETVRKLFRGHVMTMMRIYIDVTVFP